MATLRTFSQLHAETQRNRLEFLQADLALCFTFADLANTELSLGEPEAARQSFSNAEEGYATITRFLVHIDDPEHRKLIETGAENLRTQLDDLQHRLNWE